MGGLVGGVGVAFPSEQGVPLSFEGAEQPWPLLWLDDTSRSVFAKTLTYFFLNFILFFCFLGLYLWHVEVGS